MWDLWSEGKADSPYAELMTYQSEVNNGGHEQYFLNTENTGSLQMALSVLETILPQVLMNNLKKAYEAYLVLESNEDDEKAEELIFQCDDVFYEYEMQINDILQAYSSELKL